MKTWNDFLAQFGVRTAFNPLFEGEGEGGSGAAAGGEGGEGASGEGEGSGEGNGEGGEGGGKTLLGAGEGDGEGGDPKSGEGEGGDGNEPPEPLTADDIKMPEGAPEGAEFNPEELTSFLDIVNDSDLSRAELAQKLIDLQYDLANNGAQQAQEAVTEAWNTTLSEWETATRELPEIGGDKLDESLAQIKSGLDQMGATKETYQALDATGAGSHPEVVKILFNLTKHLKEGAAVQGDPAKAKLSQADRMFGQKAKD